MIGHANLNVNCDADKVIVATSRRHRPGLLPEISYEGGEAAFLERARRLRFRT